MFRAVIPSLFPSECGRLTCLKIAVDPGFATCLFRHHEVDFRDIGDVWVSQVKTIL